MENSNLKNHLKALVQLSIADRDFKYPEKMYVYTIAKANKVPEVAIDDIIKEVLQSRENEPINYEGLMEEDRFGFLYDVVQLMKIDGEVFLSEIKYCEGIAENLGYDKKVVQQMASKIYSDPSITVDKEALMEETNKYLKQ